MAWLPDGEKILKIPLPGVYLRLFTISFRTMLCLFVYCLFVSTECTNVTDRQTDRQTNGQTPHNDMGRAYASHRAATTKKLSCRRDRAMLLVIEYFAKSLIARSFKLDNPMSPTKRQYCSYIFNSFGFAYGRKVEKETHHSRGPGPITPAQYNVTLTSIDSHCQIVSRQLQPRCPDAVAQHV